MRRLVVLLVTAASCSPASIEAAGTQLWESAYDGGKSDFARDLLVAPDGSTVYVTGRSNLETWDFATAAFDADTGRISWTGRYDGGRRDYATAAAVRRDGSVLYVTGASLTETLDFVTIAYDAGTGDVMWVSEYDGPTHLQDEPTSIAVAPDGSILIVAGWTGTRSGRRQFQTVAISSDDGSVLWARTYGAKRGSAADVEVAHDGSATFVTGGRVYLDRRTGHDRRIGATVAYDLETGSRLWASSLRRFFGYDSDLTRDGSEVIATGPIEDSRGYVDFLTRALSASMGEPQWKARYSTKLGWEEPHSIEVGPDGTAYVIGYAENGTTTIAYSATGESLWVARSGQQGPFGTADVAVAPGGTDVYVAFRPSNEEILTAAYEGSTGASAWGRAWQLDVIAMGGDVWIGLAPDGSAVFTAGSGIVRDVGDAYDFNFVLAAYGT
jgi:DNA-binding beta-propeller fold protein YncE